MPTIIAQLSRIALYVNGITAVIFAARILKIRLYTTFPAISTVILLNMFSGILFSIFGSDSAIASAAWRYSSLPYSILYVLAAAELFKEPYCQWPGLRRLNRRAIARWQLIGIAIGGIALLLDHGRWGERGFDCVTLSCMEALRCTSSGLVGFVFGSFRQVQRMQISLSSTTAFLMLWLISETLPNGIILWIGVTFFPYSAVYADVCNIVTCSLTGVIAVCSLWYLKRPNLMPGQQIAVPTELNLLSLKNTVDRLLSATSGKQ